MRNQLPIDAEMAALRFKIDRQLKTINRVKADERYIQAAQVYLEQLSNKLASLERVASARKNQTRSEAKN